MKVARFFLTLFLLCFVLVIPKKALAVAYDLIPPSGTLQRGQDVQFIIDIDTMGTSVKNAAVGLQYETQYLQYKSATQGDAMTTLSVTQPSANTLSFSGTNSAGFTGVGTFAYVTFTIIAQAPGSTQLCTLIETPVTPVLKTPPPAPTQLPKSGEAVNGYRTAAIGGILLTTSIALYLWHSRNKYESAPKKHKKHA